ncbi:hypothetical protein HK099_002627, partial [Clydaea vesicula]
MVYITSIPVSIIIVRLNLLSSGLLHPTGAEFAAVYLPILVVIPFQTGNWLNIFANWSSLIFQTLCNFLMPFLVYIFTHKRNLVMNQSVLDELEFLDLGNLTSNKGEEENYDFVYHLPHADQTKIVLHNSVSELGKLDFLVKNEEVPAITKGSSQNIKTANQKKLSRALDPFFNGKKEALRNRFNRAIENGSKGSRLGGSGALGNGSRGASHGSKAFGSKAQSKANFRGSKMLGGGESHNFLGGGLGVPFNHNGGRRGSMLNTLGLQAEQLRKSMNFLQDEKDQVRIDIDADSLTKLVPSKSEISYKDSTSHSLSLNNSSAQVSSNEEDNEGIYEEAINEIQNEVPKKHFHAFPPSIRKRVHPKIIAILAFLTMVILTIYVFVQNIIHALKEAQHSTSASQNNLHKRA